MRINFGNNKSTNKIIVSSIIFSSIIAALSQCTGLEENEITDVVDKINREFIKNDAINTQIIINPELVNRRVINDVNSAIRKYETQEQINIAPKMVDKEIIKELEKYDLVQKTIINEAIYYELPKDTSRAQELLGPPMGIRLDSN